MTSLGRRLPSDNSSSRAGFVTIGATTAGDRGSDRQADSGADADPHRVVGTGKERRSDSGPDRQAGGTCRLQTWLLRLITHYRQARESRRIEGEVR